MNQSVEIFIQEAGNVGTPVLLYLASIWGDLPIYPMWAAEQQHFAQGQEGYEFGVSFILSLPLLPPDSNHTVTTIQMQTILIYFRPIGTSSTSLLHSLHGFFKCRHVQLMVLFTRTAWTKELLLSHTLPLNKTRSHTLFFFKYNAEMVMANMKWYWTVCLAHAIPALHGKHAF